MPQIITVGWPKIYTYCFTDRRTRLFEKPFKLGVDRARHCADESKILTFPQIRLESLKIFCGSQWNGTDRKRRTRMSFPDCLLARWMNFARLQKSLDQILLDQFSNLLFSTTGKITNDAFTVMCQMLLLNLHRMKQVSRRSDQNWGDTVHFFNKKFNDDLLDNCLVNPRFLFQI